jgi:hypothetical protein
MAAILSGHSPGRSTATFSRAAIVWRTTTSPLSARKDFGVVWIRVITTLLTPATAASVVGLATCVFRLTSRTPRGFGWRIHCGVEVTESSTNKQHSLSRRTHHPEGHIIHRVMGIVSHFWCGVQCGLSARCFAPCWPEFPFTVSCRPMRIRLHDTAKGNSGSASAHLVANTPCRAVYD